MLEFEITPAPPFVRDFFNSLPNELIEKIQVSQRAKDLAMIYISEKIVGETSLGDCQHIATATLNYADVLVSWNFKHIVNLSRIRGYNSINLREGYHTLDLEHQKKFLKLNKKILLWLIKNLIV